jgi:hypothetical protein
MRAGHPGGMSAMDHARSVIVVPEALLQDLVVVPEDRDEAPWHVRRVEADAGDGMAIRLERATMPGDGGARE